MDILAPPPITLYQTFLSGLIAKYFWRSLHRGSRLSLNKSPNRWACLSSVIAKYFWTSSIEALDYLYWTSTDSFLTVFNNVQHHTRLSTFLCSIIISDFIRIFADNPNAHYDSLLGMQIPS
jgi:hypothetical protein